MNIPDVRERIVPYDTTLRDGAQTPDLSLTVSNKMRIATYLAKMSFPFIEGGWPEANPTDVEFFREAKSLDLRGSQLVAFGMTGRVGIRPENDPGLEALLRADTDIITIFGKSWTLHVKEALRTTEPKNLDTIYDTVAFLRGEGRRVIYDAEHFYDGYLTNPGYALDTLRAASEAGAETLVLCDTNGGAIPESIYRATKSVRRKFPEIQLGIHVHNDSGLAVINTLAAIKAGARQVQGTINGAGERTGNVDFCVLLPTARFKYGIDGGIDLTSIYELSRFVEIENGLLVPPNTPYVGGNSFTHKGGVHISAVLRTPEAYEHIDSACVGRKTSFENSDQGGGANIMAMAEKHGFRINRNDPLYAKLVAEMKRMRVLGDAQEYLLLHRILVTPEEPFDVFNGSSVTTVRGSNPEATVKVRVNGSVLHEVAEGDGPVNAFDNALKKALGIKYPQVREIKLLRYQNSNIQMGSDAEVVIRIEFGANGDRWTSVAKGTNQQTVAEDAIIAAYQYFLLKVTLSRSSD